MVAWKWNQKSFLNGCHELRVIRRFSSQHLDLRQVSKGFTASKPHVSIDFQGMTHSLTLLVSSCLFSSLLCTIGQLDRLDQSGLLVYLASYATFFRFMIYESTVL